MKFSVIVPTYNRRVLLEKCLAGLLAQNYGNGYEIIVIDDGSTDETREYLRGLNFKNFHVLWQNHAGPAKARNLGTQKAFGDFLAFTDDDCLTPNDWLQELEFGFDSWPEAAAVGGYLEAPTEVLKLSPLARLEYFETHVIYKAGEKKYLGCFESPAGGTNNVAYRHEVFNKLGGFDENFPVPAGEDADLKLRAVKAGYKIGYVPAKMTHLDPYNLKSFLRRGIASGIGSAYFEKKHYSVGPNWLKLFWLTAVDFINLFLSPFKVLKINGQSYPVQVRRLMIVRSLLISYGKAKFWLNRSRERLVVK